MSTAVMKLEEPRLPYYTQLNERFGVDKGSWKVLVEAIYPAAASPDSVMMAIAYCKQRQLDIFKRPVHIVPMWSSAKGSYIETVWPGIGEMRTTAFRTGQFAGFDEAEFGPEVTETFSGRNRKNELREVTVTYPLWCRVTVHRLVHGQVVKFVGPKVYWKEIYGRWAGTDVPNDMWAKRPIGQIEKCAEAAALRRAFPEEIGNDYAAEEMEGQTLMSEPVAPAAAPKAPAPPALAEPQRAPVAAKAPPPAPPPPPQAPRAPAPPAEHEDERLAREVNNPPAAQTTHWLPAYEAAMKEAIGKGDYDALDDVVERYTQAMMDGSLADRNKAQVIYEDAVAELDARARG